MPSQRYDICFFVAFRVEKKQNPIIAKFSRKTTNLIERELSAKLKKPVFLKKLTPALANPIIKKFRKTLENFSFEDKEIKSSIRTPFGIEDFCFQDKGDHLIAQYKLTFFVFSKAKDYTDTYNSTLPKLLNAVKEIRIENKNVILKITDFRTSGQVKEHPQRWPANVDTYL